MVFKLNRTGSILNRNERLNFNENWDKLEKVIKDRGLEILSEEWFKQYLDTSGIKHLEEVQSFFDLPSNDSLNSVRGVLEDNKIYIKKENGWVPFQSIDPSKINLVERNNEEISVNVKSLGVKGDGVTNDTAAIEASIRFAIREKKTLFFPQGIYLIDKVRIHDVSNNAQIIIEGSGFNTIIKRMDGTFDSLNEVTFAISLLPSSGSNIKDVTFRNIQLDGNLRGNPHASGADPYAYERGGTVRCMGLNENSKVERILFDNVKLNNRVSDHLFCGGGSSAFVEEVIFDKVIAKGEESKSVRGDLTISGAVNTVFVNNCKLEKLATELNSPPSHEMVEIVSNSEIKVAQFTGKFKAKINNSIIDNLIVSYPEDIEINNSEIYSSVNQNIFNAFKGKIINTKFIYILDSNGNFKRNLFNYGVDLEIESCDFIIKGTGTVNTTNAPLYTAPTTERRKLVVNNSKFDPRFHRNVHPDRGGITMLKNNVYSSSVGNNSIEAGADPSYSDFDMIIDGGNFENIKGFSLRTFGKGKLKFLNSTIITDESDISTGGTDFLTNHTVSTRVLIVESPPDFGALVGDVARLRVPINGEPFEWVATRTNPSNAHWIAVKTL